MRSNKNAPSPDHGRGHDRGNLQNIRCSAADDGWEEHWGGHSDCGSCLAKHGGCTRTCYTYHSECTAVGINDSGVEETFLGIDENEYRARDYAISRCSYRASNCQIRSCKQESQVHSRNKCPR